MKKEVILSVSKQDVLDEVGKTTAYEGAKSSTAEEDVYAKVATTRADAEMLERFWAEACAEATGVTAEYAWSDGATGSDGAAGANGRDGANGSDRAAGADGLVLRLWMPERYNDAMTGAAEQALRSYLVNYVVSKWMALAKQGSAESYAMMAAAAVKDMKSKLDVRMRPARPRRGGCCNECSCEG